RLAILVVAEVDDDLAAHGRPQLELVAHDRPRQETATAGDLEHLHALLSVGQAVLALQLVTLVAEVPGRFGAAGGAHHTELVSARDRGVQAAEAVLAPLDLQHREGGAVDREQVADEAVVREVAEVALAPPLGVEL